MDKKKSRSRCGPTDGKNLDPEDSGVYIMQNESYNPPPLSRRKINFARRRERFWGFLLSLVFFFSFPTLFLFINYPGTLYLRILDLQSIR